MNLRTVAGAIVIAALAGAGGTLAVQALLGGGESLPATSQLSESWLQGVDIRELADQGVYLSQPPSHYLPKVSGGFAKHATDSQYSNASARQILIAHLQTESMGGFDGLVYIINYEPSEVPAECPGSHTIYAISFYAISFVDADSGKWLFSTAVGSPSIPSRACHRGPGFSDVSQPPTIPVPSATPVSQP